MDHRSLTSQLLRLQTAVPWRRGPVLARVIGRPQGGLILGPLLAGLLVLWAILGGGYDAGTWYPSALALLGVLAAVLVAGRAHRLPRALVCALGFLAAYVAWSYLSILWAGSPGDALEGSNRALLYLIVFALGAARAVVGARGAGRPVGPGRGDRSGRARHPRPPGHREPRLRRSCSTAGCPHRPATSTPAWRCSRWAALLCLTLSLHRRVPLVARALLSAMAAACLQLAVTGQSRGWLLTLPVLVLAAVAIVPARLRLAAAAVPPVLAALLPVHALTGDLRRLGRLQR